MAIVVTAEIDWTLSTLDIIKGALQLCQSHGVGETVKPADADVCMKALDGIIKELPIHGFSWPDVTSDPAAVLWSALYPAIVTPPADFFGAPVLKRTDDNLNLVELPRVAKPYWERLDLTETADYPQCFYLAPDLTIRLWPAPTKDPGLMLTYQSVLPDLVLTSPPSIQQQYINGMQFILADEISLKYGVPGDVRQELAARATQKKFLMQQWAVDLGPIVMQVEDGGCGWTHGPFSRGYN